jgi:deoxyribose-phosphate aldolase
MKNQLFMDVPFISCSSMGPGPSLASRIDHTRLAADALPGDIERLCDEARRFGFAAVCVSPCYVSLASRLLRGSVVKVGTVVGFPLGANTSAVKAFEARDAVAQGADELDMVMAVGALKAGDQARVSEDIRSVREAAPGKTLKVILETALLADPEKALACRLAEQAGADFIKTSTGFGLAGASPEDVKKIRSWVGPRTGIKASGGIRTREQALQLLAAGATRLGTSASVAIVSGAVPSN